MRKIKKLIKRLKLYFRFKKEGLSKDLRYTEYVLTRNALFIEKVDNHIPRID